MLQGGFERRSVLESDDAFANDAVAVQENRGGDALDAEALLHFGRAHEQRVVDIELEKTLRGKVGKQTFPLRLGIPQKTRDSHFPTAATTTALRLHFKWRDDPPHGYILKWLDARDVSSHRATPQTPLERVASWPQAHAARVAELQSLRESLNPFALAKAIDQKLEHIYELANRWLNPKVLQGLPATERTKSSQPNGGGKDVDHPGQESACTGVRLSPI